MLTLLAWNLAGLWKNVELLLQTAHFVTWKGRACSFRRTTSADQWQGGDFGISPLAYLLQAERSEYKAL